MAPLSLQQAVRIVLAASMLVTIISSAEELLTEPQSPSTAAASAPLQYRHPSDESPRNTDTKTTAASAPLHQSPGNPDITTSAPLHPSESKYTYTMQYQIDKKKLSGLVDTGSDLIWTSKSELLNYKSLKSCASDDDGKLTPSHGAPCFFDKTYGHGAAHVRVRLGEAKLTWAHDLIKIGSPVYLSSEICCDPIPSHSTSCGKKSFSDKNKMMACRAFRGGGIVGLGRGDLSLVSQLWLNSFSYCLPHGSTSEPGQIIFNDTTEADSLPTLDLETIQGLKYPASSRYYVGLKGIKVGTAGDVIDVPNGCFGNKPKVDDCSSSGDPSSGDDKPDHSSGDDKPDHAAPVTTSPTTSLVTTSKPDQSSADKLGVDGNRGMVIDSGTSFTTLPQKVFDRVKKEVKQLLKKETDKEPKEMPLNERGFICYEGTRPERMGNIELHFCSQGKILEIPADNYFVVDPDDNTKFCLAFKRERGGGCMSILGAYQQRGMYMLFKGDKQVMKKLSFAKRDKCT